MVSAVSPRGELHFDIQEKGVTADDFLAFCKTLIVDAGRPVFLILDNRSGPPCGHPERVRRSEQRNAHPLLPPALLA